jgi:predicted porin
MKRKLLALGAFSCGLVGSAHAQSSVTLYGLLDDGFVYNSNAKGARQYQILPGNLDGNRWGMIGAEDIGGGLKIIFRLENGFDINTGSLNQGGSEFGRRTYIGLSSPYGVVTAGRQYDALTSYISRYTAGGAGGAGVVASWAGVYAVHPGDMDNLGGTNRTENSVKFESASYHGLVNQAFYSFGNKAGDFTNQQTYSIATSYRNGPIDVGVAYDNVRDPNYSLFGDKPSSNTSTSTSALNMSSPVYSGFASAHTLQVIATGIGYMIGQFRLGGEYSNVQFQNIGAEPGAGLNPGKVKGTAKFNIGEVSMTYNPTPALQLGATFAVTRGSSIGTIAGAHYNQSAIGIDYALSKTTDLYGVGVYQLASGQDSTGKTAVATIPNLTASSNNKQMAVTFGIRHRF